MPEIVEQCPLCGSNEKSVFDQRQFRGIPVSNLICHQCGLVFQSPRMTDTERQNFYEEGYRALYQGQETPKPDDLKVQEARAKAVTLFIGEQIKTADRVLDIGCSAGILLKDLREHFRAQVVGVEPGKMYRDYAIASGLEVFPSLEKLINTRVERFNLVSMMHVLEHLPDPLGYLKNLRVTMLKPDGWLLLEVPNLYAHDCFEVAHLISYSSHSLTQLVHQAGFQLVKLRTHGIPRSRLIPLYITLLARPNSDEITLPLIHRETGVAIKRKLGIFRRTLIEKLLPRYAWQ